MKGDIKQLDFSSGTKIALIVRGKNSEQHQPGVLAQHADVILPNGDVRGFFGGGDGFSGTGGSIGFRMTGQVFNHTLFTRRRPAYVNLALARKHNMKSTVLVLSVTSAQAIKFKTFWGKLSDEPGNFSLLGDNCSTHAGEAFKAAGIIDGGIPGLDTPDNLYRFLRKRRDQSVSYSGFLGITKPANGNQYKVEIEE